MTDIKPTYVFFHTTYQNPYKEIVFHKRSTKYPKRCGAFKELLKMLDAGEVPSVGYQLEESFINN